MLAYTLMVSFVLCSALQVNSAPKKPLTSADYRAILQKHPGNIDAYCQLVTALLQEGDTVLAEQQLSYALKLTDSDVCLHTLKIRLALQSSRTQEAIRTFTDLLQHGYELEPEDTLLHELSSCCAHALQMRLKLLTQREKGTSCLLRAMASLSLLQADTIAAIEAYRLAIQRGDTLAIPLLENIRAGRAENVTGATQYSIPLIRAKGYFELQTVVNNLRIKVVIDTTAVLNTISGVESAFLLKNEYVKPTDIIDQKQLLLRSIDVGQGIVLKDIVLYNRNGQEHPIILSLQAFSQLGKAVLNETKNSIDIY